MSPSAGPNAADKALLEAEFQKQVTDLAEILGWQWTHFRPAKTAHGWVTPVSGTIGKGWPDLTLIRARDKRLLFVECKRVGKVPGPDQDRVLEALRRAGQDVRVWSAVDWPEIEATLR